MSGCEATQLAVAAINQSRLRPIGRQPILAMSQESSLDSVSALRLLYDLLGADWS